MSSYFINMTQKIALLVRMEEENELWKTIKIRIDSNLTSEIRGEDILENKIPTSPFNNGYQTSLRLRNVAERAELRAPLAPWNSS